MTQQPTKQAQSDELALLVSEQGRAEQTLAKFIKLLLNYKYGLVTEQIANFTGVRGIFKRLGECIRCAFVIQRRPVTARSTIPVLTANGRIPLF